MTQHDYTVVDELRTATRFAKERGSEVAVIWRPQGEPMLVDVHDESLGGLGVYIAESESPAVGNEFEIVYSGELLRARVCHVEPSEGGEHLVGLACERVVPEVTSVSWMISS